MGQESNQSKIDWDEQDSQTFIDFGHYFVPDRELQIRTICDLIPASKEPFHILELCCGEGLLAGALLERFPNCIVHGLDGSRETLQRAKTNLAQYGERFDVKLFDLASRSWRHPPWPIHAVTSSLAIHHLNAQQKQELFQDIQQMLFPGGVFLVVDLIQPANQLGVEVAAKAWEDAVRQRSLELDGNTRAVEYFRQEQWNCYVYPDPVDKPSRLFDQLKWLERAGFVEVDMYWMKAGHTIFGGRKSKD
ncbi:MAG: class I SAM-dependent methyltransferase [Candidatus Bipolaricaulia bacterium]